MFRVVWAWNSRVLGGFGHGARLVSGSWKVHGAYS